MNRHHSPNGMARMQQRSTQKKLKQTASEGQEIIRKFDFIFAAGKIMSALVGVAVGDILVNPYGYAFEAKRPYNPNPVVPIEKK